MQQHTAHWGVVPVVFLFTLLTGCGSSSNTATTSDLEQAKGAVTELRTWSTQIANLESKGGAFSGQLDAASVSGQIAANAVEALRYAMQAMSNAYLSGNASPYDLMRYMPANFSGSAVGSIVQTGTKLSLSNATVDGNAVSIIISAPNLNGAASAYTLDVVKAEVTNATTFARIDKATVEAKYPSSTSLSNIAAGIYTDQPDKLMIEAQGTVGQNSSTLVPNPVVYTGRFIFTAQRPNNLHAGEPNLGRILMSGEFKNNTSSFGAAFEVNMRNAATFVPVQTVPTAATENATYWRDIDGALTFTAKLDGLPEAQFIEAFDRTAYDGVTGSITVVYGNVTIKLEDSFKASKETGLKLTLTVTNGGKTTVVAIEPDATDKTRSTGIVMVNGNKVGTIKAAKNGSGLIVTYNDGTFETVTF